MKKLYRSQKNAMIAGVCSGLGNYLNIDPTIVRLIFVFMAFYQFLGVWVYLVMAIMLPQAPADYDEMTAFQPGERSQTTMVIGGGLIVVGVLALISMLDFPWFGWMQLENIWPVLLILLGGLLLARALNMEE